MNQTNTGPVVACGPSQSKSTFVMNPHAAVFNPDSFYCIPSVTSSSNITKAHCSDMNWSKTKRSTEEKVTSKSILIRSEFMVDKQALLLMLSQACGKIKSSYFMDNTKKILVGTVAFKSYLAAEKAIDISSFNGHPLRIAQYDEGRGNAGPLGNPSNTSLVIKNLPFKLTEENMKQELEKLGVSAVDIQFHRDLSGSFKGIVFAKFPNLHISGIVLSLLNSNVKVGGRKLYAEYKKRDSRKKTSIFSQPDYNYFYNELNIYANSAKTNKNVNPLKLKFEDPSVRNAVRNKASTMGLFSQEYQGDDLHLIFFPHGKDHTTVSIHGPKTLDSLSLQNTHNRRSTTRHGVGGRNRERGTGSNASLQSDRYARGPDGTRGFPPDRGNSLCYSCKSTLS